MSTAITYEAGNGAVYSGTFVVDHGMVYVHAEGHRHVTQRGGTPAEVIARMLLAEMVGMFGLKPSRSKP